MIIAFPSEPTNDKNLLVNIVVSGWYNESLELEPDAWNILQSLNNNQLRLVLDDTISMDYRYGSFIKKSIKLCYGGGFFGPSTIAMNNFLTDIRHAIQKI